jgi:hypothetical protein
MSALGQKQKSPPVVVMSGLLVDADTPKDRPRSEPSEPARVGMAGGGVAPADECSWPGYRVLGLSPLNGAHNDQQDDRSDHRRDNGGD